MILATEEQLAIILDITERRVRQLFKDDRVKEGTYPLISCIQKYIKQTRDGDINYVTLKTLAEITNLSEKTVRKYTKEGLFKKLKNGKYDLKSSLKSYLESRDERNRKKEIDRKIAEVKLNIMESNYHSNEDIEYILTDMLMRFKSKLNSTAYKIDNEIDDIKEFDRIEYLKNILTKTLDELSEYNPPNKGDKNV